MFLCDPLIILCVPSTAAPLRMKQLADKKQVRWMSRNFLQFL